MEITVPALTLDNKRKLARDLTAAYANSTGMDKERIGIRFLEYGEGESAYAGELWEGGAGRCYVHVMLYCPRQSRKVKQELVRQMNDSLQSYLASGECRPVIHIQEHPYDNVGVDGRLLSDLYAELAERDFYYSLNDD